MAPAAGVVDLHRVAQDHKISIQIHEAMEDLFNEDEVVRIGVDILSLTWLIRLRVLWRTIRTSALVLITKSLHPLILMPLVVVVDEVEVGAVSVVVVVVLEVVHPLQL